MRNRGAFSLSLAKALFLALVATLTVLPAQESLSGKWGTEVPGALSSLDLVTMDLKVDGGKVTGSVARTAAPGQAPVNIENGTATTNTITFAVKSPDGQRAITFTGKLKGDEIEFTREVKGAGGGNGLYGLDGPKTLTARRLTSAPSQGAATPTARLEFAASSVRLWGRLFDDAGKLIPDAPIPRTSLIKCQGADGLLWADKEYYNAYPARRGRCTGPAVSLDGLVLAAYASSSLTRLVGFPLNRPKEGAPVVQIEAVAGDPERVTKGELQQMLRTLLEDRFKARVHTETREVDGHVLTIAKSGIKFKETPADAAPSGCGSYANPYSAEGQCTIQMLIPKLMGGLAGGPPGPALPIADKTGLTGTYDIKFLVEDPRFPAGAVVTRGEGGGGGGPEGKLEFSPPVSKSIEDQLGLHVERGRVLVEFIVIDHLELPTEN
jgi:uncharacterized protein (TIGR03435 family)